MTTAAACDAYVEELVAYLDAEQPEAERARIDAHVGTCLTCRRELERLRRVRALIGEELRPIEPSASFEQGFWRRLDAEAPRATPRKARARFATWGLPALAAAAVVALASYSLLPRSTREERAATPGTVAEAPRHAAGHDATRLAHRESAPEPVKPAAEEPRQLANADQGDIDQYPPELVEHPELFLRLPVVRRLEKLQHFEEVRRHGEGELAPEPNPAG